MVTFLFVAALLSLNVFALIPKPTSFIVNGVGKNILPFKDNKIDAVNYGKLICQGFYDFYSEQGKLKEVNDYAAYDGTFGATNEFFSDNAVYKPFGKTPIKNKEKNNNIRDTLAMSRAITTFSVPDGVTPCALDEDNANFEAGPNYIAYDVVRLVYVSDIPGNIQQSLTLSVKYIFNNDGRVQTIITTSPNGQSQFGRIIDWSLSAAQHAFNAASYLNIIDTQEKNEYDNLLIIKKMFYAILICIALLFAVIIAMCTKYVVGEGKRTKYSQVSNDTDITL